MSKTNDKQLDFVTMRGPLTVEAAGDEKGVAACLGDLGELARRQGSYDRAFKLVISGVAVVFFGALFGLEALMWIGYLVTLAGVVFYMMQIYIIAKLTVRKEWDIWAKSMVFAFGTLGFSIVVGIVAFLTGKEAFLHAAVWFLLLGFISSMITGHLYKIVPFLVWFERFAPLVGKEKVPMLHEMYPKEGASMMFWFTASGVVIGGFGLMAESDLFFKAGASFLFIGAIFLYVTMQKMLSYGE